METLGQLSRQLILPDNYFVADVETCGFSFDRDYIVEVGWAVIRDRTIRDNNGLLLDWTRHPGVDQDYLRSQLDKLQERFAGEGRTWYYPYERLRDEGVPPIEALHTYITLMYEYIAANEAIVGHGLYRFDRRMIDAHAQRFLQGYQLPWRQNTIIDTGLIEKAAQLVRNPWPAETLDEWMRRLNNASAAGVKWNLAMCAQKYRLAERYNLDMRHAHIGGFDCRLTHHLLETFRELMEILCGQRTELSYAGNCPGWTGRQG